MQDKIRILRDRWQEKPIIPVFMSLNDIMYFMEKYRKNLPSGVEHEFCISMMEGIKKFLSHNIQNDKIPRSVLGKLASADEEVSKEVEKRIGKPRKKGNS